MTINPIGLNYLSQGFSLPQTNEVSLNPFLSPQTSVFGPQIPAFPNQEMGFNNTFLNNFNYIPPVSVLPLLDSLFTMPQFNLSLPQFNLSFNSNQMGFNPFQFNFNNPFENFVIGNSKIGDSQSVDYVKKTDKEVMELLKQYGYNEEKGRKLAKIAKKRCRGKSQKQCATWVKNDIVEAGLGSYYQGSGKDTGNLYKSNKNFRLISGNEIKDWSKLPPGCIMVYGAGVAGYDGVHGHVQIMGEDGIGYYDGKSINIKKGTCILIPV